jgi:hypothetical protein
LDLEAKIRKVSKAFNEEQNLMKKLLYVCEADSGGIMEYAIRQSAAIAKEGVEVRFLCKPSFPMDRLATGIILEKFQERRGARVEGWRGS